MKRIRFLALLLARGFTGPQASAIVRACDKVTPLVMSGADPHIALRLVKALANEVNRTQEART